MVWGIIAAAIAYNMIYGYVIGPIWTVWAERKEGDAAYAKARGQQRIQVAQPQARLDAAELNKKAALVEAEAVGLQIKEIGKELTAHNLYLQWQWIDMMRHRNAKSDTIYVPTEAGLPILEANRFPKA